MCVFIHIVTNNRVEHRLKRRESFTRILTQYEVAGKRLGNACAFALGESLNGVNHMLRNNNVAVHSGKYYGEDKKMC